MRVTPEVNVPCKICLKRRAKRYCPGVGGDICAVCCGTERENTVDCPLTCEHLQAARKHERAASLSDENLPNRDIRVTEEFLEEHQQVVMWLALALNAAIEKQRAIDLDAREALDALIRTYRTRESGLIYETRPQNPYAAAIQDELRGSIEELDKRMAEERGMHTLRDAEVLKCLAFLQRLELSYNNGRRRGRAFADFLKTSFPAPSPAAV